MLIAGLHRRIATCFAHRTMRDVVFTNGIGSCVGLSTIDHSVPYQWDGMKRGGNPDQLLVVMQYTFAGWGCFQEGAEGEHLPIQRVDAGSGFVAIVPSEHRYWLPRESASWTFMWTCFHHPYAVRRMAEESRGIPAVYALGPEDPLVAALARHVSAVAEGMAEDRFICEGDQLNLAIAYARHVERMRHPDARRIELMTLVRNHLKNHGWIYRSIDDVARSVGMTRWGFTRAFKAGTGMSPASFVIQIRLEEARRQLAEGDDPLARIADRCGFADANHLCRWFRRRFHQTPGQYRRQVRQRGV